MSNSTLVDYTKISPNSTNPRRGKIKKITIHHAAGNLTVEALGNVFAPRARKASANYGIGTDGRVGLYVEEKNRAWTSKNANNDNQAITIEVANSSSGGDWPVSDTALEKLIDLCARNDIPELIYTGDATGTLTRHNMFAATACPGPYLQSKFPHIAEEVNRRLGVPNAAPTPPDAAPQPPPEIKFVPYTVRVTVDLLNIRSGPGTDNPINGNIKNRGVYTIVEEADGRGASRWGKLKSGAGWISLDFTRKA